MTSDTAPAQPVETGVRKSAATRLLVLSGDGIGPEIVAATIDVLRAADALFGLNLTFEYGTIGLTSLDSVGTTIADEVVARVTGTTRR